MYPDYVYEAFELIIIDEAFDDRVGGYDFRRESDLEILRCRQRLLNKLPNNVSEEELLEGYETWEKNRRFDSEQLNLL